MNKLLFSLLMGSVVMAASAQTTTGATNASTPAPAIASAQDAAPGKKEGHGEHHTHSKAAPTAAAATK